MSILVAGGTGLIGKQLVNALLAKGENVTVLGRSKTNIESIFDNRVKALEWSNLSSENPEHFSAVINLCGRSISALRWTEAIKNEILSSRIHSTTIITEWCSKATTKPHLYNASAIGIYGLQPTGTTLPPRLTEEDHPPISPIDFLSRVGIAWEDAAKNSADPDLPLTFLRFGVVLKADGGALNAMLTPFKWGLGSRLGSGMQPFSWVHIDDVVAGILFLLKHPTIVGPVNIVAPECISQDTFARTLAKALNRPYVFSTPTWFIQMLFGQMGDELLLNGQHVFPARLLNEKFTFQYPTLNEALNKECR